MTTDFRALCAELTEKLDELNCLYKVPSQSALIERALDALAEADEPAVPDGREPAAVTGQPSDEELVSFLVDVAAQHDKNIYWCNPLVLARAVLARWGNPAPAPPADGEVAELVDWLQEAGRLLSRRPDIQCRVELSLFTRTAELLQRQALVPVAVSERPWEREGWCDAEGRCWWGRGESDDWSADWTLATPEAVAEFCEFSPRTVCLPAHALPLPEVGE